MIPTNVTYNVSDNLYYLNKSKPTLEYVFTSGTKIISWECTNILYTELFIFQILFQLVDVHFVNNSNETGIEANK